MMRGIKHSETEAELLGKAEQGDAEAQLRIASCYYLGSPGMTKDEVKYVKWITKAAEQGKPDALFGLGTCYINGSSGLEKDEKKGAELYRSAVEVLRKQAEQGDVVAQVELGRCYFTGFAVSMDKKIAFDWYVKAARQGNARAMQMMGWSYFDSYNWGEEPGDREKELEWHRKAAEHGSAEAQMHMGSLYSMGNGKDGVERDIGKAIEWYMRAAEQNHADAQLKLAGCYLAKEPAEAVKWFERAAEEHWNVYASTYGEAQKELGKCYMNGAGVERDEKKAWGLLAKAAANGDRVAKLHVEELKRAEQGDAGAQYVLATRFLNEGDFAKDEKKALEWLGRAAAQGHTKATKMIKDIKAGRRIRAF